MAVSPIIRATAFVDWNSQIHAARPPHGASEGIVAGKVLEYVCRLIGRSLTEAEPENRYDVELRVYHGWYRGFEATARRRALVQVAAGAEFATLSAKANVLIRPQLQFGDNLISGSDSRLHARLGCHLPNTLRKSLKHDDELEEKMVDTAIASDLVDLAHREPHRWLVVLGEDDDLVPPVFAADGIRGRNDGRVILIRDRADGPFLKLHSLRPTS
jgi:hypothetical protein